MRKVFKNLSFTTPRVTKNSTSVPNNKKMSMTFKISNQDVHTKQTNQKSSQTKRQHCCDPQCSSNTENRAGGFSDQMLYHIAAPYPHTY